MRDDRPAPVAKMVPSPGRLKQKRMNRLRSSNKIRLTAAVLCLAQCFFILTSCSGSRLPTVPFPSPTDGSAITAAALQTKASSAQQEEGSASGTAAYYFPRAGQKAQPELLKIIGSAKKTLDVAIYCLTDPQVADAIVQAKKRSVTVRVLTDHDQSTVKDQKALLNSIKKAGIPIKMNSHSGIMHLKVTIADASVVTTGSYNYTKAANTINDEVFVVLNSASAAADFEKEFNRMWSDTKGYKNY